MLILNELQVMRESLASQSPEAESDAERRSSRMNKHADEAKRKYRLGLSLRRRLNNHSLSQNVMSNTARQLVKDYDSGLLRQL